MSFQDYVPLLYWLIYLNNQFHNFSYVLVSSNSNLHLEYTLLPFYKYYFKYID